MRRLNRSPRLWLALIALTVGATSLPARSATPDEKSVEYYGVYFQKSRIGRLVNTRQPTRFKGRDACRLKSETAIKLKALTEVEVSIVLTYVISKEGRPLRLHMTTDSLGRSTEVTARYFPDRVEATQKIGDRVTPKTIPIPKGVVLIGDPDLELKQTGKAQSLEVGRKTTYHFFEPNTLTLQKVEITVLQKSTREVHGKQVPAFQIEMSSSLLGTSKKWMDAQGRLLEDTDQSGIRLVLETAAGPPPVAYAPPKDFALATAIQTPKPLPGARKLSRLTVRFRGVPNRALILSDPRQQAGKITAAGDRFSVEYTLTAKAPPSTGLPRLKPDATAPFLKDTPLLGLRQPAIADRAAEIIGGETDRAQIARRIRAWIHGHMQKPANIAVPRAASEIMSSREGVCRDYATLFTALARASGVPTRVCAGVVYFRTGFFYHAWVECQLADGPDGWTPFDATLPDDFVDATHIKFAQGEAKDIYRVAGLVGKLRAEVISSAPRKADGD